MSRNRWSLAVAGALALSASLPPDSASACGGFFCSQAQGVNQAAERIVFAHDGGGTVTAVIEIQYQGPAEEFSWLLPISSVPSDDQIRVASSLSFQRLQQATNPQYSLSTRVEGTCDSPSGNGTGGTASGGLGFPSEGGESAAGGASGDDGVTVEASGLVGAFEWQVISLSTDLTDPAGSAVEWLNQNGYDVPPGAPGLLGPYLDEGLYLLALKLKKGANAGSIRPIVLTYEASQPMIPIKLTAVAANEDMGVLTWVLGGGQAVPQNYYALELNEARINWFNPSSNYNDVVIAAADEAGGQGFVTELAQPASTLRNRIWSEGERAQWEAFVERAASRPERELVIEAIFEYAQWDGFWDVVREHVELPADASLQEVQDCPECISDYRVSADFMTALERDVIEPAGVIQELLDRYPYVTRLYSTLSAAEMTVDPLFTLNPDLPLVNNVHLAERVIECERGYYQWEAPWRIELPQGDVIRGGPSTLGTWPEEFDAQPANRRILRRGESGSGKIVEDNSEVIGESVASYSASLLKPPRHFTAPGERGPLLPPGQTPAGAADGEQLSVDGGGCGCSVPASRGAPPALAAGLLASALLLGRRRSRSPKR